MNRNYKDKNNKHNTWDKRKNLRCWKYNRKKIDSLAKENIKSNKFLTQNIQEIWDTMKRTNLRIIGIEEGEEIQLKGTENIFNKIIEENFPNLKNLWRYKKITDHQIDSIKKQKTNKFNLTYDNQSTKHTE